MLLVAASLRLWRLDLAQFRYDDAAAAALVAAWKYQGLFPLTGIETSVFLPNPPAWPYLLALGLVPATNPWASLAVGVGCGIATALLCWWVGRRWLGAAGGLAAGWFYAVSFWPVMVGRSTWQPAFLPFFALLAMDALLMLAVRRQPVGLVLACGWLAVIIQLHYLTGIFVLFVPVAAWIARKQVRAEHLAASALVAAILLLPFALYEVHPDVRLRDLRHLLVVSGGASVVDGLSLRYLVDLAGIGGAADYGVPSQVSLQAALSPWWSAGWIGPVLAGAGLLMGLARKGGTVFAWGLAAWTTLLTLFLVRHSAEVYRHYLYVLMPALALAVGAASQSISAAWGRRGGMVLGGALAIYAAASVGSIATVLTFMQQANAWDRYGIPAMYTLSAAQMALDERDPTGEVLIGGHWRDAAPARFALGYNIPARVFDDCRELPTSAGATYLLLSDDTPGAEALRTSGAPLLGRVQRPDGDAYVIYGSPPRMPPVLDLGSRPAAQSPVCRARGD